MKESVYKFIELVGTSDESWEKAAKVAVETAGKTLRDLRIAEIVTLDMQDRERRGRPLPGQGQAIVQVRGRGLS